MVLGKLPVPGRPTILITVGQGPTALAVGAGGGCLNIFTLIYPFSPLSPSLWETARYRLKYCLKGPLNPKQPTNQHQGTEGLQYFFGCKRMVPSPISLRQTLQNNQNNLDPSYKSKVLNLLIYTDDPSYLDFGFLE